MQLADVEPARPIVIDNWFEELQARVPTDRKIQGDTGDRELPLPFGERRSPHITRTSGFYGRSTTANSLLTL